MVKNQSRRKIGIAVLVFALLVVFGIAFSKTAKGQSPNDRYAQEVVPNRSYQNPRGRNWELYGNYGGSQQLRQTALNAGYREGITEARKDRETGQFANLNGQGTFQRATKDYSRGLGDREVYRRYFREAFEEAYNAERYAQNSGDRGGKWKRNDNGKQNRRGLDSDGYGNFGGSSQLRQTALNAGFNEGVKQGRTDRNKRNSSGYQNRSTFQKATKDYSSGLGDREVYQRYFREAYEHGYSDGYSGY
jgi:hypothetical protein